MSTKRKHSESNEIAAVHADRQAQVPGSLPRPTKKPRRHDPNKPLQKQVHASSVNTIKKKIRDVTRRLNSDSIPANVRVEDERALTAYQQELAAAEHMKKRNKMIGKYHKVRFFERQKATKVLKKLRKRLLETESTEEVESLKKQMHISEVDLNYAQYYPLDEPYISLFAKSANGEEKDEATLQDPTKKPPMWAEIERRMEAGTLDQLRNGQRFPSVGQTTVKKPVSKNPVTKKAPTTTKRENANFAQVKPAPIPTSRRLRRQAERDDAALEAQKKEEENDSDGGFFEE